MVLVKELIAKLQTFDPNEVVTIDASNHDGAAWADLMVGGTIIADTVDYYNSSEIQLY